MTKRSSSCKSIKTTIRFHPSQQESVEKAAKHKGYSSVSAFLRDVIEKELNGKETLAGTEERLAASFQRIGRDIYRVGRGQQALFALVDTLAKTLLTCLPEPLPDAKREAITRARERYEVLIRTAGRAMGGDSRTVMHDLVEQSGPGETEG